MEPSPAKTTAALTPMTRRRFMMCGVLSFRVVGRSVVEVHEAGEDVVLASQTWDERPALCREALEHASDAGRVVLVIGSAVSSGVALLAEGAGRCTEAVAVGAPAGEAEDGVGEDV